MFSKTAILSYSNSHYGEDWQMQPDPDPPITSLNLSGDGDYCKMYSTFNELRWYCNDGQPSDWTVQPSSTAHNWNYYNASTMQYKGHHKKVALWFKKTSHNNTAGTTQVLYHNGSNITGVNSGVFKLYFENGGNKLKLLIGCHNSSAGTYAHDVLTFKGTVNEGVWHFVYLCWNTYTNKLLGWLRHQDVENGHEDCYYHPNENSAFRYAGGWDGWTPSKPLSEWTDDEETLMTYYYHVKNDTDFAIHTKILHANKTESYIGAKMDGSTASEFFYGSISHFGISAYYPGTSYRNVDRNAVWYLSHGTGISWPSYRNTTGIDSTFYFGDNEGQWLYPDTETDSGNWSKGGKWITGANNKDFDKIGSNEIRFIYSQNYMYGMANYSITGGLNPLSCDGLLAGTASEWRNQNKNNYSHSDSIHSRLNYYNSDTDNTDPTHDTSPYSTATNGWTYDDGSNEYDRKFVRDGSGQTSPGVLTNDMWISATQPSGRYNYTPALNASRYRWYGADGGIVAIGHPYRVRLWLNVTQNSTSNDTITFGGVTIYDDNQSGEITIDTIVQPTSTAGLVITAFSNGSGQSTSMEYLGGGIHYHTNTMIGVNLSGTVRGTGSISDDTPHFKF